LVVCVVVGVRRVSANGEKARVGQAAKIEEGSWGEQRGEQRQ